MYYSCIMLGISSFFPMSQVVKNQPEMQTTWVRSLGWEDTLEEEMATQSSILVWRIPWTEEPGGLRSRLQRGCKQSDTTGHTHIHTHWKREWQPTPVLLLGEFHGWRSLVGCSPQGCKESEWLSDLQTHICISQYLIKVSYYYDDAILPSSHFAFLFSVPLKNMFNSKVSCLKADTIFLKVLLMAWN